MIGITEWVGFLAASQACAQLANISLNTTTSERLKGLWKNKKNPYRKSCLQNWEEVCGPRSYCPLWCCPFPLPRVEDGFGYPKEPGDDENCPFIGDTL
jgi:hypothetical protein